MAGSVRSRPAVPSAVRKGKYDLWPNMIMLFCLQSYYDHTADTRVLEPDDQILPVGIARAGRRFPATASGSSNARRTTSTASIGSTTERATRGCSISPTKIHRHTANWTDDVANWHNVNMAQAFGGPTTYFMQSGDPRHLRASYRNYAKIRDLYGQVPGGMFAGDENCRAGFHDPHQAIETCGMVEMMLSHETLVGITGDLLWADRCEDVAFNSLPAALTADFRRCGI